MAERAAQEGEREDCGAGWKATETVDATRDKSYIRRWMAGAKSSMSSGNLKKA
jgi:hypothetical protein